MNIKGKNINNKTIAIIVAVIIALVGVIGVSMSSSKSSANSGKEADNSQNNNIAKDEDKSPAEETNKEGSSEKENEEEETTVTITKENKDFTKEFVKPDKIVFNKDGDAVSLTEEENNDKFTAVMNIINKMFNDDMTLKETTVTLDDMSNILMEENAIQLLYADDQKGNFKINAGESGAEKTYNEVIIPLSGDSSSLVFLYGAEQATYSEALSEFKYGEEVKKIME